MKKKNVRLMLRYLVLIAVGLVMPVSYTHLFGAAGSAPHERPHCGYV